MLFIIPHGFEPNYTVGFVKGLAANGISFCVISSDVDEIRLNGANIDNVNLRGSQNSKRLPIIKAITILKYYLKLGTLLVKNRGSVVHFTGIFGNASILIDGIFLNAFLKFIGRRYIYTAHNSLPHGKEKSKFFEWIYNIAYKMPDNIVVHTEQTKRELINRFSVHEGKVTVISIGINEEMPISGMTLQEARSRLGLSEQDNVILFFGKADEYKGLDTLISAFDIIGVPNAKLLISGWFPSRNYRRKITNAISASNRRDDIILREGFIRNEEVEVLFKASDVVALPYRHIYQSGVVFLCYHFGKPVVSTDVGSLREFLGDGLGIVAETNDVEGFAKSLKHFFENKDQFISSKIIEKTRKYKWEEICNKLLPLYQ